MAHKVESMMSVRDVPWHGLGTILQNVATSAEAIMAAGMNWEVMMERLTMPDGQIVPDRRAVVRVHDRRYFATVGMQYTPVQNLQAFEFFDSTVGEGQAIYHTAGSLDGGRRVWILAKLPQTAYVKGIDAVENNLLLCNSHDASLSFQMLWTPIRVVCNNTLNGALGKRVGQTFMARHTKNIQAQIDRAQRTLGLSVAHFGDFMEMAENIANKAVVQAQLDEFVNYVFDVQDVANLSGGRNEALERVKELFETAPDLQMAGIRETQWAMYNALTAYVDHEKGNGKTGTDKRMDSAWFGPGADLKERAWAWVARS